MATDFASLITSEHNDKPKFMATVELLTGAMAELQETLASLETKFDVDTAEGQQLDFIGEWVGIGRVLDAPLAVYFSFDIVGLGFDEGTWFGPGDSIGGVVALDDETYRLVIRATIAADHWDGTLTSYQLIMTAALAGTGNTLYAIDNQNMTINIVVTGPPLSEIVRGIINAGQLAIKPLGVSIAGYTLP